MIPKKLANEPGIRSSPKLHPLKAVNGLEFGLEHFGEGLYPRATCPDQRSIYIKQHQPYHPAKLESRAGSGNLITLAINYPKILLATHKPSALRSQSGNSFPQFAFCNFIFQFAMASL